MDIHAQITIAAPASHVWLLLGERFGDIAQWATPITASALQGSPSAGAVRQCHTLGFGPVAPGVIYERLTRFQPEDMSFDYEAERGLPDFIAGAVNRWRVVAVDSRTCKVLAHATLALQWPLRLATPILQRRMTSDSQHVLEELKHVAELGRPHPRKAASLNRATRAATIVVE